MGNSICPADRCIVYYVEYLIGGEKNEKDNDVINDACGINFGRM